MVCSSFINLFCFSFIVEESFWIIFPLGNFLRVEDLWWTFFRKICKLREVFQQGNFTRVELPLILYPFLTHHLASVSVESSSRSYFHIDTFSAVASFLVRKLTGGVMELSRENFFVHLRIVSTMKFAKPETKLKLDEVEIYRTTAVLFSRVHSRSWAPGSVAKVESEEAHKVLNGFSVNKAKHQ